MDNVKPRAGPMDLSHHYSYTTRNRLPSRLKLFYKYFSIPGIGQLAGGLPNDQYFPYDTLEAKTALPERWSPSNINSVASGSGDSAKQKTPPAEAHLVVPHGADTTDPLKKIDLMSALQYGRAQGYPPLYSFLKEFTNKHMHPNIPYDGGADIILTCGSTDGFSKTIELFNNVWVEGRDPVERREGLLVEEYAYMNAVQTARPRGMNIISVKMDEQGMLAQGPGGLEDVLENWDFSRGKRPHLMYTVTMGQNPTSGLLSTPRRKEIYSLCQTFDIIIVEDDPYWYLQYPSTRQVPIEKPEKSSGFEFLDSLQPSYLSIDVDGRVVRLDTFSKTVAPGCRLGWITATPNITERLLRIAETSTQQPSGFVQSMIAEMLIGPPKHGSGSGGSKDGSGWDVSGWVRWLEGLRGEYERRMDIMATVLEQGRKKIKMGRRPSLSSMMRASGLEHEDRDWSVIETTSLYDFYRPAAGMFLWLSIRFEHHPLIEKVVGPRLGTALMAFLTTKPFKVLVSPGAIFASTPELAEQQAWKCFRLCFAAVRKEEVEPISKRFSKGVAAFFDIKDVKTIDELLKDMDNPDFIQLEEDTAMITGWC